MYYGNVPFYGTVPTQPSLGFSFIPGFQQTSMLPQTTPTHLSIEQIHLTQRMDLLCQQVAHLTEMLRTYGAILSTQQQIRGMSPVASMLSPGQVFGTPVPTQGSAGFFGGAPVGFSGMSSSPVGVGWEHSALQIRETESFICWQIPFPNLNLGDVDVEVLGNRIICRTKTVIHPTHRFWQWSVLPQGVQFFELPDGRVECSAVIPVAFDANEVEAVFKDGAIAIYVPKSETGQRQTVKIGKEVPQYVTAKTSHAARTLS